MASRLTSVRLDEDALDRLRLIAEVNDTNIAAEIREAVRLHVAQTEADDFATRLDEAQTRQRETLYRLVPSLRRQEADLSSSKI